MGFSKAAMCRRRSIFRIGIARLEHSELVIVDFLVPHAFHSHKFSVNALFTEPGRLSAEERNNSAMLL